MTHDSSKVKKDIDFSKTISKEMFKHTLTRAMRYMRMDGGLGIKECFDRELVYIVKWSKIKFIGHQFWPCSPSVKNARSELGERSCEETKIFHFSHGFIKKEQISDSVVQKYTNNYFMSDNVGSNKSAVVYYTNMAKKRENKTLALGKAWNINIVTTTSSLHTILPISKGLLLPLPPEIYWCTVYARFVRGLW